MAGCAISGKSYIIKKDKQWHIAFTFSIDNALYLQIFDKNSAIKCKVSMHVLGWHIICIYFVTFLSIKCPILPSLHDNCKQIEAMCRCILWLNLFFFSMQWSKASILSKLRTPIFSKMYKHNVAIQHHLF